MIASLLIIDNYDSFTYNIVHYLEPYCTQLDVIRPHQVQLSMISCYDGIVISPGPGLPNDYPILIDVIKVYGKTKPILGICLGHQAIGEAFGGTLINLPEIHHGVSRETRVIASDALFDTLPEIFLTARYHSWVVDRNNLPAELMVTAIDSKGYIMALSHIRYPVKGIQFHPESILTPNGKIIFRNWITYIQKQKTEFALYENNTIISPSL